jgi:hypothetical protein
VVAKFLKLRPLLWLAAVLLLAFLVSFTWEQWTSYDDGGIGTLSFVVVTLLSLPGEFLGLSYVASAGLSLALLVGLDRLVSGRYRRGPRV